jgi:hypothetical protein
MSDNNLTIKSLMRDYAAELRTCADILEKVADRPDYDDHDVLCGCTVNQGQKTAQTYKRIIKQMRAVEEKGSSVTET